jgi:phage terminase large subunit GpA-like protein
MVGVNYQGVKLKNGIKLYVLGVDRAKSTLLSRCKIETPGTKYLNVPADLTRFWAEGFAGSEVLLTKHRNGKPYYVWEQISNIRNEPLDCAVYAFACAILCGVHRDSYNWARLRKLLTVDKVLKDPKSSVDNYPPTIEEKIEPEKPVKKVAPRKQNSRFDY